MATSWNDAALREAQHRCGNDLQMVVGLINLTRAQIADPQAADLLSDLANRVNVLVKARRGLAQGTTRDLAAALTDVCEALRPLAEPRGVSITLEGCERPMMLREGAALTAALTVNELVTNAIKHAFDDRGGGTVLVRQSETRPGEACIVVEDDGWPFNPTNTARGTGLTLIRRLVDQQEGLLILPDDGSKRFELRLRTGMSDTIASRPVSRRSEFDRPIA